MRWPLRYQIMWPMAAVMLLAVLSVGGVGAVLGVRGTKARIDAQIREVAQIVAASNFPLTAPVLRQMRALSGAELILVDGDGRAIAASGPHDDVSGLSRDVAPHAELGILGSERVRLRNRSFFHTVMRVPARRGAEGMTRLHILYPEHEYRRAWQRAVYPSLAFVVVALPVVFVLSLATGARIAGRVGRLREQVDRIAEGGFEQRSGS